uniref:Elastin microfibril interfacer 1 n=1 Tax=Spermophilus dauricus TaxID=99837 RepID=A0A8C9QTM8_SPEDA
MGSGLHKVGAAGEAQQATLEGLQGIVGQLQERVDAQEKTATELTLQLNLTVAQLSQLKGLLQARGDEGCGACGGVQEELGRLRDGVERCSCPLLPPRGPGAGPGVGGPSRGPLDGFSVFGGSSGSALQALQGELSEVILTFSSLNDSLHELQTTVEGQGADLADLGATKDSIISEINRLQQEATEHATESEEVDVVAGSVTVLSGRRGSELGGATGQGGHPPGYTSLASRLSRLEDRFNSTLGPSEEQEEGWPGGPRGLGLWLPAAQGRLERLEGLLANVSGELGGRLDLLEEQVAGAVQACGQLCSGAPGDQDSQVSEILSALERRVLDSESQLRLMGSGLHKVGAAGEAQQATLEGLQGIVGQLQERVDAQEKTATELTLQLNLTVAQLSQLKGLLQARGDEGCGACGGVQEELGRLRDGVERCSCPLLPPRGPGAGPGVGGPSRGPLDGFSVFGGSSGSALQALQGELSEVILTFSSLNDSLHELQTTVEGQGADLADLGATKDSIISEINRLQQEATEHATESEERFRGLEEGQAQAGQCPSLEGRLGRLEGVCERLDTVAGGLQGLREGLSRHVAGLWAGLRETNSTSQTQAALLEKLLGGQAGLGRRLGALNSSLLLLEDRLQQISLRDLTGKGQEEAWGDPFQSLSFFSHPTIAQA